MKNIGIRGYKAFNKEHNFDLAPINLLIGPNGSGKSSLIKTMVLSKGLFETKLPSQYVRIDDLMNDIFGSPNEKIFSYRLLNLFDPLAKFNQTDLNYNRNQWDNTIEITHSLDLSFFEDKFALKIGYRINPDGNALLFKITLETTENKNKLLTITITPNSGSRILNISVKINYKYLRDFVDKILLENKHFETHKNFSDYFKSTINNEDEEFSEEDFQSHREMIDEYKLEGNEFRRRCNSGFYDENHVEPQPSFTKKIQTDQVVLFNKLIQVGDINLYDYAKLDSKYERDIKIKLKEIESKLNFIEFEFYRESFFINDSLDNYFDIVNCNELKLLKSEYEEIDEYNELLKFIEKNEISAQIHTTDKYEIIINNLLFKNISQNLSVLDFKFENIIYQPAVRNSQSFNKSIHLNDDMVVNILKKINRVSFSNLWEAPTKYFLQYWISHFGLSNKISLDKFNSLSEFYEEILIRQNLISHSHGYNQLLPIICSIGFFADRFSISNLEASYRDSHIFSKETGNIFLIEEPEANLHPNFQSKLADLFIDAAWKFNHQFVIETHSEYMVRKFQYWVAKGKIDPSVVNIYYFDNKNDDPEIKDVVVKKININKDGSLSEPFGEGFYDEALNLQFELLKLKNINKN